MTSFTVIVSGFCGIVIKLKWTYEFDEVVGHCDAVWGWLTWVHYWKIFVLVICGDFRIRDQNVGREFICRILNIPIPKRCRIYICWEINVTVNHKNLRTPCKSIKLYNNVFTYFLRYKTTTIRLLLLVILAKNPLTLQSNFVAFYFNENNILQDIRKFVQQ